MIHDLISGQSLKLSVSCNMQSSNSIVNDGWVISPKKKKKKKNDNEIKIK